MSQFFFRIAITGILFLLMVASGIWLGKSGKPYSTIIFTIHKLIALFTMVFTAIIIYKLQKAVDINNLLLLLMILTAVLFVLSFVTGAILSFDKPVREIILILHKYTPILLTVFFALTFYLLTRQI